MDKPSFDEIKKISTRLVTEANHSRFAFNSLSEKGGTISQQQLCKELALLHQRTGTLAQIAFELSEGIIDIEKEHNHINHDDIYRNFSMITKILRDNKLMK